MCVRVRSLLSEVCGMHSGFWVLLFLYIDLLHRQVAPVGLESAWAKRPASAGATGLWIWLGQARDAGLQRKNRWKDWRSSLEKNHWDDRSWNTAMLQCCWGILLSLSKSILIAGILIAIYHPCIKSDFRYDLGSHWAWPPGGLASGSRWSLASLKVDEEAGKCWTWGQPWQKGMAAPKFWSFHVIWMISFIFILGSENTWTKYKKKQRMPPGFSCFFQVVYGFFKSQSPSQSPSQWSPAGRPHLGGSDLERCDGSSDEVPLGHPITGANQEQLELGQVMMVIYIVISAIYHLYTTYISYVAMFFPHLPGEGC